MPHFYIRIYLLWTCSFTLSLHLPASTPASFTPPQLSNPSACNLGLPIKDFSCDASHFFEINVTNAPGTSLGTDVYLKEVRLIISHKWAADLDVTLISPNDVAIDLTSDNGSGMDDYGNPLDCSQYTTFISESSPGACNVPNITTGLAPFIGVYLSEQNFLPLHDGTNPNNRWTLQICDDGKEHTGALEFVQLVFEPLVCLNPTDLTIVSVDSNTVRLDWTTGLFCDSTIIEIGPVGFSPGSGFSNGSPNSIVVIDSCPPVSVIGQGLAASTTYEVYIRGKCPLGFSQNSCPVSFTTTCSPPTVSLREDFNTQTNCTAICGFECPINGLWTNSKMDDFDWIVSDKSNITTNGTGPSDDHPGGGKYIYIESSQSLCRSGREGVLISNCIQVKAGADSCDMSYDCLLYGVHVNTLKLEYKETNSNQWFLLDIVQGNKGNKWETRYVNLDHLNGLTVQFRFVALGGNGTRADIALDNILFFGSEDLGPPPFVYYYDDDGDGYGGQSIYFATCAPQSGTAGFVSNNLDCDDLSPNIHPDAMETPCDGIDQNCNGDADEFDFLPPSAIDTTVCSGAIVPFMAVPRYGGQLIWYAHPTDTDHVFIGNEYLLPNFPTNYSSTPITLSCYVRERVNPICLSSQLTPVNITILPQADINTTDLLEACEGQTIDLSTVDVIDNNGANGIISYHNDVPVSPFNEINPMVIPTTGDSYYIASTPAGGCADVVEVMFNILPTPKTLIMGQDSVCKESAQTLTAIDENDIMLPYTYLWNNGKTTPTIDIASHPLLDSSYHYAVTITATNGCSSADQMPVTTIANISQVRRTPTDVSTCDGSNGAILLEPLDGIAPFTFNWGNGQVYVGDSLSLNGLSQGAYAFTITDNSEQKCPFVIPGMTVNGPGAVVVSSQVTDVSCNGLDDGCIIMNVNGNAPIVTWEDGSHETSLCNLHARTYRVPITDGDCENQLEFEVKQPNKLIVSPTIVPPSCHGGSNGSIELNVFGGSPPYQFNWQNGIKTQKINNLTAGNYPVTITDSKGCSQEFPSLLVTAPNPISFDTTALVKPSCFGLTDGKISIKPFGGTTPFDVDWSNGAMGTTINSLASGTYVVSIEDAKGCLFTQPVLLDQPMPLSISMDDFTDPSCKGLSDGEINITANGGTGPLSFQWSNSNTNEDLTGLAEGNYFVTVTDANQCSFASERIALAGPELINISAVVTNPPCIGKNEGAVSILNDPSLYTFEWDFDESEPTITQQGPGSYTVTVTEIASGCQLDTTFILTAQQNLTVNYEKNPPACDGQANGWIRINAAGFAPLTYHWGDTSQNTNERNFLSAGNYFATITDANGCIISTGDILLEDPPPITLDVLTVDMPLCHGDSTGIIDVLASGGTGKLEYSWTTGDTVTLINQLGKGFYQLTVTDEKNCVASSGYQITWPEKLTLQQKPFFSGCNSLDSICIEVSGGIPGYNFAWNNGDATACLKDVAEGDYVVTVTDHTGCTAEMMSVKMTEDANPIYLQQLVSKDSICFGETNGELAVLVDGGTYPYQYIWSNGVAGTSNNPTLHLGNLPVGQYRVTITDHTGCTTVSSYLPIVKGQAINADIQTISVNCKGGIDGQIELSVTGGFSPYHFTWTNSSGDTLSSNTSILNGLSTGAYAVQIVDSQNCTFDTSAYIPEPNHQLGSDSYISAVSCFNGMDGSIQVEPTGGTPPYAFLWSNGATTPVNTALSAHTYTLIITDANDCIIHDTFLVEGPDRALSLDSFEINEPFCFGVSDGSIDVDMGGGTPPYTYDWGISNDEDLLNIGANE